MKRKKRLEILLSEREEEALTRLVVSTEATAAAIIRQLILQADRRQRDEAA